MKPQGMNHLKIKTSKGFAFNIPHSVLLTTYPSIGIIFFLECSVRFFDGDDFIELYQTQNPVSFLSLRGKTLAIGEKMLKGQLTTTTILNLEAKKPKFYKYQKTAIESLSLSANCEYLCSVGSSDISKQLQQFLIINLVDELEFGFRTIIEEQYEKKKGRIVAAVFSNKDPNLLALTLTNSFIIIRIDEGKASKKLAKSSKVREFSMGLFDPQDINCYVSSKNGDISQISIKEMKQVRVGPRKRVIISGIKHIRYITGNRIVITGVKGFIGLIELTELKILRQVTIKEEILSLTQFEGELGFVATEKGNIYILDASTLDIKQFYSCHCAKVNQICFLESYSEIFASCADRQIVLWRTSNLSPIIKISLPNATCLSLNLLRDGSSIVSGWSDECIRFWNPKTGKKTNQIPNAHVGKVTALTSNNNSDRLYSGGEDGRIRSWKLEKDRFGIIDNIYSGHKSVVHFLKLYGEELISCSEDGTFAIWNHATSERKAMVKVSNFLKKIIPIDQYLVYGVGSGPNLLTIAKNDGRILEQIYVGGSHLNDFDGIAVQKPQQQSSQKFLVFGGEKHSVFLRRIDEVFGSNDEKCEQYSAYGQVTCVKFSPDTGSLIAGTDDGSLLCYDFISQGII